MAGGYSDAMDLERGEEPRSRGISPRLVGALILIGLLGAFVAENRRKAEIRFLIPRVTVALWVALFVAVLLGAVVGALLSRHRRR